MTVNFTFLSRLMRRIQAESTYERTVREHAGGLPSGQMTHLRRALGQPMNDPLAPYPSYPSTVGLGELEGRQKEH